MIPPLMAVVELSNICERGGQVSDVGELATLARKTKKKEKTNLILSAPLVARLVNTLKSGLN